MLTYSEVKSNVLPQVYIVDNGYTGNTEKVQLSFVENHIFEVSESGYYSAPVLKAIDAYELIWLVDNHPAMRRRYKKV